MPPSSRSGTTWDSLRRITRGSAACISSDTSSLSFQDREFVGRTGSSGAGSLVAIPSRFSIQAGQSIDALTHRWMLQRLPISKTMGSMIISWGILVMCMAAPRSFAGMAAIRTLLGATEALITPGFVLLISRFYRRDEQPLRVGLWYACNGVGSFVGALISYGMGHVQVARIPNWSWIFILNGVITIVFGFIFLVFCPESPESYRGFTPREREIVLERVRGNKSSLHSRTWKWYQFKEAVCPWIDPQGWAYFVIVLCMTIPNGGIANFLHLIVSTLPPQS